MRGPVRLSRIVVGGWVFDEDGQGLAFIASPKTEIEVLTSVFKRWRKLLFLCNLLLNR